jgi:hypothetical protein
MFWTFVLLAALAFGLIRLGMYSVWVSVLFGGLQLALFVIVCLAVALIWRLAVERKA